MTPNALTGAPDAAPIIKRPAPVNQDTSGDNPKPTKGPLQSRPASPNGYATSGMERAMGAQADKMHPPKLRNR